MPFPGEHLATIETRWASNVQRIFDTPEGAALAPPPHLWPAYLYSNISRRGFYAPPQGTRAEPAVYARVNHGRWLTACPFCASQQHASPSDQWFYCAHCHNEAVGSASVPVVWPNDAAAIEALLLGRPFRENRNWEPGESVEDLGRENVEHGVLA